MLVVKYPESVTNKQSAEQAWIHFVDFLDMCEGILKSGISKEIVGSYSHNIMCRGKCQLLYRRCADILYWS